MAIKYKTREEAKKADPKGKTIQSGSNTFYSQSDFTKTHQTGSKANAPVYNYDNKDVKGVWDPIETRWEDPTTEAEKLEMSQTKQTSQVKNLLDLEAGASKQMDTMGNVELSAQEREFLTKQLGLDKTERIDEYGNVMGGTWLSDQELISRYEQVNKNTWQGLGNVASVFGGIGGIGGALKSINIGKGLNVGVSETATIANQAKVGVLGKLLEGVKSSKLLNNNLVKVGVAYFGFNQIIGSASKRTSKIESAVGKLGERISNNVEAASYGVPVEDVYSNILELEQQLLSYEETLQTLKKRNPELVLNPEAMDSAFMEIEKQKDLIFKSKQKLMVLAANPPQENVENLALIYERLGKQNE